MKTLIKRNWRNYSKEKLIESLKAVRWELGIGQVQPFWNNFEAKLVAVVDELAPLAQFTNNSIKRTNTPSTVIKKERLRKRLLNQRKTNPTNELRSRD